jgi:UDP:flavonoid glycosyltransferase YjiC (YdhE family)
MNASDAGAPGVPFCGEERAAMRVLLTTWAWNSHYLPLVPTMWALRAAGHEVRVASQPRLGPVITESGGVAVPVGPDLDHDEVRARAMRDLSLRTVPAVPAVGESMIGWSADRRAKVARVFSVFTAYSEAMADELLEYAGWWRPDLVVYDPTTYAGPLVAAALGIPAVRHTHGVDVTYQAREVVAGLIAPLAERIGVSGVDITGALTLDPCPPSLQIESPVRRTHLRYVPYNGPAVLPEWSWNRTDDRRRVCVTWGTSTSRLAADTSVSLPDLIEWTRELDCEVIACVGPDDAATLGPVPDGVRVAESLPLHLVLPSCAAIIHQGGNGTLLTAGYHGVPQLALPQLPDQTFHARRIAAAGAGRVLLDAEVGPDTVTAELAKLLTSKESSDAADALRADIEAQPAPADIVGRLAEFAAGR